MDDADTYFVDLDAVRTMEAQGAPFTQGLRVGYLDYGESIAGLMLTGDRGHFLRKAMASAKGLNVQPDMPSLWPTLASASVPEFDAARARLLAALDAGGRRTAPADAAKAQVAFDCWMRETAVGNTDDAAKCKAEFEQAIASVERSLGPAAPSQHLAFFAWDSVYISPVARTIIEQAAADYKAGRVVQLNIAGHTDRSGSAAYNQGLSVRRAQAVAKLLGELGVPASALTVQGFGETRPAVPTADGVREERNRRVEITFN